MYNTDLPCTYLAAFQVHSNNTKPFVKMVASAYSPPRRQHRRGASLEKPLNEQTSSNSPNAPNSSTDRTLSSWVGAIFGLGWPPAPPFSQRTSDEYRDIDDWRVNGTTADQPQTSPASCRSLIPWWAKLLL